MRSLHRAIHCVLVAGAMVCALPGQIRAAGSLTVNAGYDLFRSTTGTSVPGLGDMLGVPLGTYDFGSGAVSVGEADTIVHRLDTVTVGAIGDAGTTRLEVVALQLKTVMPVDFGGLGLDTYFVTLQSLHGGPASVGSMDITFTSLEGGTFTSFFDVFFDIRKGSLDGPIVFSHDLLLTNDGADWNRIAPPGAMLIDGITHFLNGTDNATDFWPATTIVEKHPSGANHKVKVAGVPEPASWAMAASALVVGLVVSRSRRRP